MEETKALHKLQEAADLVGMIEDLLNPNMSERMSPSAWSGVRITLRNVKDMISNSHNTLANDLIQRSKAGLAGANAISAAAHEIARPAVEPPLRTEMHGAAPNGNGQNSPVQVTRRDLKASLERFIER